MHALVFLLLAQPGDAVQTHDLGHLSWQRAKALEGRLVRVRFTVGPLGWVAVPSEGPEAVLVVAAGPESEWRLVRVKKRDVRALTAGTRLEAEGVLRVAWCAGPNEGAGFFAVELASARLVK